MILSKNDLVHPISHYSNGKTKHRNVKNTRNNEAMVVIFRHSILSIIYNGYA